MARTIPVIKSAFTSPADEFSGAGKRPVVFDVLAPDFQTSLLPEELRLVLHVNPSSMQFSYAKVIERIQTRGGFVEQHFGEGVESIAFEMATGGFVRLYSGLSNITGGGLEVGGTRRDTIAYDKYLDMLSLFHNNGSIFDARGQIVFQGIVKCTFDGGEWLGWFNGFGVSEDVEQPYQFKLSTNFTIAQEFMNLKSTLSRPANEEGITDLAERELVETIREREAGRQLEEQRASTGTTAGFEEVS